MTRKLFCLNSIWILFLTQSCGTSKPAVHPISEVDRGQARAAANEVKSLNPGTSIGKGQGYSMLPIYGENTYLVIAPIDFTDLEIGMIVAYRTRNQNISVHRLVRREGSGWVAQGLNNLDEDPELVTTFNLLGMIYASFTGDPGDS